LQKVIAAIPPISHRELFAQFVDDQWLLDMVRPSSIKGSSKQLEFMAKLIIDRIVPKGDKTNFPRSAPPEYT